MLLAFAAGYIVGARAGREGLSEVAESIRAIRDSEEFAALVSATRSYVGHVLEEVSAMVAPDAERPLGAADLLDRLRDARSAVDSRLGPD
ncbi:MAG TPA: hypothetical protein VG476_07410 [Acidimicrobiales bacterium]|nr:hypothetical protein [Acidimicrobiales bacterium]